jgi:hypothetical protein
MIAKICSICSKRFLTQKCYLKRGGGKYCSQKCAKVALSKQSAWWIKKGVPSIGFKNGKLNPMWKGNKVSKSAIHDWIKRRKFKPELCEKCQSRKSIDLANISQEYKRNLSDWKYICRRCHMEEDGRLKIFMSYAYSYNKRYEVV